MQAAEVRDVTQIGGALSQSPQPNANLFARRSQVGSVPTSTQIGSSPRVAHRPIAVEGHQTAPGRLGQTTSAPSVDDWRPKVLQVLEATGGGTGCYLANLLLHIDTAAFDLSFAYSPVRADERFWRDLRDIENRGIRLHEIPIFRNIRPLEDLRALLSLCHLIRAYQFDIVHAHSSKAGFLARVAAKIVNPRIKTIYSPHAISMSFSPKYWFLERFAAFFTDMVLGVSLSERNELESYKLVPASKLRYATAGIDLSSYIGSFGGYEIRRRIGVPEGAILIGTAGRLTAQKDPVTFVKGAARLLARGAPVHFAWAGDGDLRSTSQELAKELGIEKHVTFVGHCLDLRPFLDSLDIFALTSRYESFGYVTCEAMAMSKPVVATNVAGTNELVQHGETGYLIEVGDEIGLAAALHELASDLRLRRKMGAAGRARAWKEYDVRRTIWDIERIYRELFWAEYEVTDVKRAEGLCG